MLLLFFQICLLFLKLSIAVADGVHKILVNIYDVLETPISNEAVRQAGAPILKMLLQICLLLLKLSDVVAGGVHTILINIYNVLEKGIQNEVVHQEPILPEVKDEPQAGPSNRMKRGNLSPESSSTESSPTQDVPSTRFVHQKQPVSSSELSMVHDLFRRAVIHRQGEGDIQ